MVVGPSDRSPAHLAFRGWLVDGGRVPLLRRVCLRCGTIFGICRSCFRGQRYCSDSCRKDARAEKHRASNRRHQRSPEGRDNHRDRQRDYRKRLKDRGVTDQSCSAKTAPRSLFQIAASEGDPHEAAHGGDGADPPPRGGRPEGAAVCIFCGRPGFFVSAGEGDWGVEELRAGRLDRRWRDRQGRDRAGQGRDPAIRRPRCGRGQPPGPRGAGCPRPRCRPGPSEREAESPSSPSPRARDLGAFRAEGSHHPPCRGRPLPPHLLRE